jgi:hypothetical protein
MDEVNDKWDMLATNYWKKFENSFNNMTLEYDEDESGAIDEEEEGHKPGELRIGRA